MINKSIPGFNFNEPKVRVVNLIFSSVAVVGGTRRLRATWTPELAQDVTTFQAFDAERELTAFLSEEISQEIDRQIINDLNQNQRFYDQNTISTIVNRWDNILINDDHRPEWQNPQFGELEHPEQSFNNIAFPMVRRVFSRLLGNDITSVQPLEIAPLSLPTGILHYVDYNYNLLPNEEGWHSNTTFESIFIKMDMKPFQFLQKIKSRRSLFPPRRGIVHPNRFFTR